MGVNNSNQWFESLSVQGCLCLLALAPSERCWGLAAPAVQEVTASGLSATCLEAAAPLVPLMHCLRLAAQAALGPGGRGR